MHKSQSLFNLTTALHVSGVTITFHDSSRQQYGVTVTGWCSYSCSVLLTMGDNDARKHVGHLSDKINSVTCASSWNYIL